MQTWMEGSQPDRDDLEKVEGRAFDTRTMTVVAYTYYRVRKPHEDADDRPETDRDDAHPRRGGGGSSQE